MTTITFSTFQLFVLIVCAFIILSSIITFKLDKDKTALILLFIGSVALGFFIANLDPFLNLWDEQYHALVAKNMLKNPFKPILFSKTLIDYNYKDWTENHIWLHKQPLFLWQIAISLKLFGINELSVRIPSIFLHALTTLMIYRIGKICTNPNIGFYGALFFSVAYYPLELIVGFYSTDHNDIAFLFYITVTFWSWFEYQKSQNKYWLIVIGFFSGCAVLIKWLVGLLIYAGWGISILINDTLKIKSYIPILISFSISLFVFLPWQIFIFYHYPLEAMHEFQINSEHIFNVIENHGGNGWFHFNALKNIYGSGILVPFLLLIGLFIFIKKIEKSIYRIVIIAVIIIVYSFYSIVATKMISYCIIVAPFGFLALASLTDSILNFLKTKVKNNKICLILNSIALFYICFLLIDIQKIQHNHTENEINTNYYRNISLKQMDIIRKIEEKLLDKNYVIFNSDIRAKGHTSIMFYTNFIAYNFIPTKTQIELIKKQLYKIAIIETTNLPDYIQNDTEIIKIK